MVIWNFINGLDKKPIDSVNPIWISALEAALQSQATPFQSGYHVNTGGATRDGKIVSGANHEMAITDSITHGEEAVIAAALDQYGKDDPLQVIAFIASEGGKIASPCGNCRDAIKQYTDLDNLVIINAPRDEGVAVVVPGRAFFKDSFDEITGDGKKGLLSSAGFSEAVKAEKNAYGIYLSEASPRVYGAAIECVNGAVFRGSFRGNVAYHPDLPISAAIANFRDGSDDPTRIKVRSIIVAAAARPEVLYKDRQDALEFAEAVQSLSGKSGQALPVYLIDAGNNRVFRTDTSEWLPFSFSPQHLGLANAVADGYRRILQL